MQHINYQRAGWFVKKVILVNFGTKIVVFYFLFRIWSKFLIIIFSAKRTRTAWHDGCRFGAGVPACAHVSGSRLHARNSRFGSYSWNGNNSSKLRRNAKYVSRSSSNFNAGFARNAASDCAADWIPSLYATWHGSEYRTHEKSLFCAAWTISGMCI